MKTSALIFICLLLNINFLYAGDKAAFASSTCLGFLRGASTLNFASRLGTLDTVIDGVNVREELAGLRVGIMSMPESMDTLYVNGPMDIVSQDSLRSIERIDYLLRMEDLRGMNYSFTANRQEVWRVLTSMSTREFEYEVFDEFRHWRTTANFGLGDFMQFFPLSFGASGAVVYASNGDIGTAAVFTAFGGIMSFGLLSKIFRRMSTGSSGTVLPFRALDRMSSFALAETSDVDHLGQHLSMSFEVPSQIVSMLMSGRDNNGLLRRYFDRDIGHPIGDFGEIETVQIDLFVWRDLTQAEEDQLRMATFIQRGQ